MGGWCWALPDPGRDLHGEVQGGNHPQTASTPMAITVASQGPGRGLEHATLHGGVRSHVSCPHFGGLCDGGPALLRSFCLFLVPGGGGHSPPQPGPPASLGSTSALPGRPVRAQVRPRCLGPAPAGSTPFLPRM